MGRSGSPPSCPRTARSSARREILDEGERVAILIGQGARGAAAEVERVADVLGAGVAKALNGRDVLPDDLPYVTGSIGLLGTKPSDEMMQGCDTLLMIGSGFPYSEWLPEPGQARGVQIDIDAKMLGIRYPMEVNLAGDAQRTLQALPRPPRRARTIAAGSRRSRRTSSAGGGSSRIRPSSPRMGSIP